MRRETAPLPVLATGTGTAVALDVSLLVDKAVQFFDDPGTFIGTFDLEESIDGEHWGKGVIGISDADIHGTKSIYVINAAAQAVRVNVTARSAGTFSAVIAGRNSRTDGG